MIKIESTASRVARRCFREPIAEIAEAARHLHGAVTAHLQGDLRLAEDLIRLADMPAIREWVESLWGKNSLYVQYRSVPGTDPLSNELRTIERMPTAEEKKAIHLRDGYHCRFCGIPVIRSAIRVRIRKAYPHALSWGRYNKDQHAAFQAMWAQYDHVLPHARGGTNDLGNIVLTCAPCNFGRMNYTLDEVALLDPRVRDPVETVWDGLERFNWPEIRQ